MKGELTSGESANLSLLAAPIEDEEIFELLERLAATEEMFKAPVSTIRDVAELTEASPNLIARILGEIRGPGEFEKLVKRVEVLEGKFGESAEEIPEEVEMSIDEKEKEKLFGLMVFGVAILVCFIPLIISMLRSILNANYQ